MSIITSEQAENIGPELLLWAARLGITRDDYAPPEGKFEIAFVDLVHQRPMEEVIVPEWENDRPPFLKDTPGWSIYWVTDQQITDYIKKVGVK